METDEVKKMMASTTLEMEKAKSILQDLANEVTAMTEIIEPALTRQIVALRSARMAVVGEVQAALPAFREVRAFFTDANYDRELAQLERFVAACSKLKELKDSGALDAIQNCMVAMSK